MSEQINRPTGEEQGAADEAAQHVVDEVTSYQYSGDEQQISEELDKGLDEAGVQVGDREKQRLVDEIDQVKNDEDGGTPTVDGAEPQR